MGRRKNTTPVVIVRKAKKLRKGTHLGLLVATGGLSAPFTATRAGLIAGYNARTRELAGENEPSSIPDDEWARRRVAEILARQAERAGGSSVDGGQPG